MLDEGKNNYLCVLYGESDDIGACFVDVSTGELNLTSVAVKDGLSAILANVARFSPSELLYNNNMPFEKEIVNYAKERLNSSTEKLDDYYYSNTKIKEVILRHFNEENLTDLKLGDYSVKTKALGATLSYLLKTQKTLLDSICNINIFTSGQYMNLDNTTRRNLELTETMLHKSKKGSLLSVLDKTKTAMGKRQIRKYVEEPLLSVGKIQKRQNAVAELFDNVAMRSNLAYALNGIFDIERILSRIAFGSVMPKELKALAQTLQHLPNLKFELKDARTELLSAIRDNIDEMSDIATLIEDSIVDEPPANIKEGGVIKPGYNKTLDSIVADMSGGKDIIKTIEAQEKEKTGIPKLKVGYNRVFGYYIEVTNSYKEQVPEHYIRKQTLTNCERYITQELKQLEERVLTAKDRAIALEHELYEEIRKTIAKEHNRLSTTASMIASLDALISLATVASENNYVCPDITSDGSIEIKDGRHPVVEEVLKSTPFVPNDTYLNMTDSRCAVITGPNMAGKSTYMRQVALIVLMAQIGSFVPAKSARISVVDAIFTRVGASDDLATGQSTFMVEMKEVSNILLNATKHSLLIFDEIGRGTSTFDGMSIAKAVIEYTVSKRKLGAKALFSTHYHELTSMEDELEGIKNYNIAAKKKGDDIIFLRKIVRGGTDDSYGIEVAKLAGIPTTVVTRAREILNDLESDKAIYELKNKDFSKKSGIEYQKLSDKGADLIDQLRRLDLNTLTPIEAMQELYNIVEKAKEI
jgi:DNA mismatch repair protein MutS